MPRSELAGRVLQSWASRPAGEAPGPGSLPSHGIARIAVACSGGCDSVVLLDVLASLRDQLGVELVVLHVDHGLQAGSHEWGTFVRERARSLGLDSRVLGIHVARDAGSSLEESAREARHAALESACRDVGAQVLALAHHADDQAETVLLQLTRGAGVAGLAAMAGWDARRAILRWRPLLGSRRADLEAHAREQSLAWITDPSNADRRFARNAMRLDVMPAIEQFAPGAAIAIARSARHLQSMLALEREVATADLEAVRSGEGLSIACLAALSPARRTATLRAFLRERGVRAPGTGRLDEAWRQLWTSRPAAQPSLRLGSGVRLVRHRDRLALAGVSSEVAPTSTATLAWRDQDEWCVPGWPGRYRFVRGAHGVPEPVLRSGTLEARARCGGDRLRLAADRPRRSLKQLYQALAIPTWERDAAPLLFHDGVLVHVPRVGSIPQWSAIGSTDAPVARRSIVWTPDEGTRGSV